MDEKLIKLVNNIIENILNPVIMLAFAVAVLFLIWGIAKYVRKADEPAERALAAKHIFWGIIGLAIMVGAFGIVGIVTKTFNINNKPVDNINPFK